MFPLAHFLYLSAILFSAGLVVVIIKKNMIMILLGIELMLNAANLNLVAFSQYSEGTEGHLFVLFVIVVAVSEAAVGLAIIINVYRHYHTSVPDDINELTE
jgi:NADH-quinone oxidoreductase subunit K